MSLSEAKMRTYLATLYDSLDYLHIDIPESCIAGVVHNTVFCDVRAPRFSSPNSQTLFFQKIPTLNYYCN